MQNQKRNLDCMKIVLEKCSHSLQFNCCCKPVLLGVAERIGDRKLVIRRIFETQMQDRLKRKDKNSWLVTNKVSRAFVYEEGTYNQTKC